MYTGIYKLAGHAVCIQSLYPDVHTLCKAYVTQDAAEETIFITQEDIDFEAVKSQEVKEKEGQDYITSPSSLETLAVYRKLADLMIDWGVLLFHGSAVAVDGRCYLFTARSGTGKSTHVRLWRKLLGDRAVMVNDDKPLLSVTPQGVTVFGTPWDGKHHLSSNTSAPLQAICMLTRGETNSCKEVKPSEILQHLMAQCYLPQHPLRKIKALELLDQLCAQARFFRLACNMNPDAAITSFTAMAPLTIEDMLRFHGTLIHHIRGISMEPLLKAGRDVVMLKACQSAAHHDVVLFKRSNGQYVIHRITAVLPDYYEITGDNCMLPEKVYPHQLLAVMTHFVRKGKKHSVEEPAYLRYVKLWHTTFAFRYIYNIVTRICRKISGSTHAASKNYS